MEEPIGKKKILSSLYWKFLERGGTQGLQFVVSVILARLLLPSDYGIIGLITIFISISAVFVQSGFGTALIQKANADETDFSSVFFLSLAVATALYLLLFFTAPIIARFYREPILVPVIRVLAITLLFGAINCVQNAMVSRTMLFRRFFFSSMGGIIGSGGLGIAMAYRGYGVWSLVAQQLTNNLLVTCILWFTVKWRPRAHFSFWRVKTLFNFSGKLLASSLLDTVFTNIYGLVIGKVYNAAMLGFYNRAFQFPNIIESNIDASIQSVMLPALASRQNDRPAVKSMARRSMKTSSYIIMPLMLGMAAIAKPLVSLLLTDRWLPCVPFVRLLCLSFAIMPIQTANLSAINALGRSDIFLKLELIKKALVTVALVISIPLGIYAMVIGRVITAYMASFINSYPNKRLMNYTFFEQWKDMLPSMLLAAFMAGVALCVEMLHLRNSLTVLIQIAIGMIIYIGGSKVLHFESYEYLMKTLKDFRR
jgi:O-antigen/teichoic acid export membrane protein